MYNIIVYGERIALIRGLCYTIYWETKFCVAKPTESVCFAGKQTEENFGKVYEKLGNTSVDSESLFRQLEPFEFYGTFQINFLI